MVTPSVLPFGLAALGEIKALLEAKRWVDLRALIDLPTVWVWDRPLAGPEFHDALAATFEPAVDVHLLVLAALKLERQQDMTRASYTCCVLWAYPGNWEEHDVEFDVHLGYTGDDEPPFKVNYFGITAPTPEVIPFPDGAASDPQATATRGRQRGYASAAPAWPHRSSCRSRKPRLVRDTERSPGCQRDWGTTRFEGSKVGLQCAY